MSTATYHSSAPVPRYDIQRNDFVNGNYQVPRNDLFDMGLEGSFYPQVQVPIPPCSPVVQQPKNNLSYFQPHQTDLASTFPTNLVTYCNGGLLPTFQPYNAVPQLQSQHSCSTSLSPGPSSGPSTSLQSSLPVTPSPLSLPKVQRVNPKTKSKGKRVARNATQTAKGQLLIGKPRRKRGPNKRPAGTAFSNLLDGLPDEVRQALERDYGCCETVNIKDASTKQKHILSLRHSRNLPSKYQEYVPNFVCPAFVAFKSNCRSKAGRYDSTDRHCKNCVGFLQISRNTKEPFPVMITRSQYTAIHNYRAIRASREGKQATGDQSGEQADDQIRLVLAEMFKDGFPDWFPVNDFRVGGESNDAGPSEVVSAQQPIATTSTTTTTPAYAPHSVMDGLEQIFNDESFVFDPKFVGECAEALKDEFPPITDEAGFDVTVAYASALSSYTMSSPAPIGSSQKQQSCQPLGLACVDNEGESSASGSSTSLAPAPLARVEEQHSFYQPSPQGWEGFDECDATHAFLSEFLQG